MVLTAAMAVHIALLTATVACPRLQPPPPGPHLAALRRRHEPCRPVGGLAQVVGAPRLAVRHHAVHGPRPYPDACAQAPEQHHLLPRHSPQQFQRPWAAHSRPSFCYCCSCAVAC
jgi:hypothetical protein